MSNEIDVNREKHKKSSIDPRPGEPQPQPNDPTIPLPIGPGKFIDQEIQKNWNKCVQDILDNFSPQLEVAIEYQKSALELYKRSTDAYMDIMTKLTKQNVESYSSIVQNFTENSIKYTDLVLHSNIDAYRGAMQS